MVGKISGIPLIYSPVTDCAAADVKAYADLDDWEIAEGEADF